HWWCRDGILYAVHDAQVRSVCSCVVLFVALCITTVLTHRGCPLMKKYTCLTLLTLFLLVATGSITLAQDGGEIVPNPKAVTLRKIWEKRGRPLMNDRFGRAQCAVGDVNG